MGFEHTAHPDCLQEARGQESAGIARGERETVNGTSTSLEGAQLVSHDLIWYRRPPHVRAEAADRLTHR